MKWGGTASMQGTGWWSLRCGEHCTPKSHGHTGQAAGGHFLGPMVIKADFLEKVT